MRRPDIHQSIQLFARHASKLHNHPNGNLKPSTGDIEITREIQRAAEALGVALHDHLIVGPGGHVSLRQSGKLGR